MSAISQKVDVVSTKLQGMFGRLSSEFSSGLLAKFTMPLTMMKKFVEPFAELVMLARPAEVNRMNMAFKDAMAVIGRAMTPVVQAATAAIREFGDILAQNEPTLRALGNRVAETITALFKAYKTAADESPMMMGLIAEALSTALSAVQALGEALAGLAILMNKLVTPIAKLLGFSASPTNPDASSQFAAVRDVTTQTSAEAVSRSAIERAIGQGRQDPMVKVADHANKIEEYLKYIWEWLNKLELPKLPAGLGGAAKQAASGDFVGLGARLGGWLASAATR